MKKSTTSRDIKEVFKNKWFTFLCLSIVITGILKLFLPDAIRTQIQLALTPIMFIVVFFLLISHMQRLEDLEEEIKKLKNQND